MTDSEAYQYASSLGTMDRMSRWSYDPYSSSEEGGCWTVTVSSSVLSGHARTDGDAQGIDNRRRDGDCNYSSCDKGSCRGEEDSGEKQTKLQSTHRDYEYGNEKAYMAKEGLLQVLKACASPKDSEPSGLAVPDCDEAPAGGPPPKRFRRQDNLRRKSERDPV